VTSPWLSEKLLIAELKEAQLDGEPIIKKALSLVKLERAHGSQVRLGGGSVLEEHIYPLTSLVLKLSKGLPKPKVVLRVVATLGHDLDEDTEVKLPEIQQELGDEAARLIDILTDVGKSTDEYFRRIEENEDASLIKVCDRWNNILCAHKIPEPNEIIIFCDETVRFVLPLAERVCPEAVQIMRLTIAKLRLQVST
jgi:(p)ppGpp synthase/HD superfamily hydrolase